MTQDINTNDDIYDKVKLEIIKEDNNFFPYIIKGDIEKDT